MCKTKKYHNMSNPNIDECIRDWIKLLEKLGITNIMACCCGHGKYSKTIVLKGIRCNYEGFSGELIPRTKKYYKRDKKGYYYIPEVEKCK